MLSTLTEGECDLLTRNPLRGTYPFSYPFYHPQKKTKRRRGSEFPETSEGLSNGGNGTEKSKAKKVDVFGRMKSLKMAKTGVSPSRAVMLQWRGAVGRVKLAEAAADAVRARDEAAQEDKLAAEAEASKTVADNMTRIGRRWGSTHGTQTKKEGEGDAGEEHQVSIHDELEAMTLTTTMVKDVQASVKESGYIDDPLRDMHSLDIEERLRLLKMRLGRPFRTLCIRSPEPVTLALVKLATSQEPNIYLRRHKHIRKKHAKVAAARSKVREEALKKKKRHDEAQQALADAAGDMQTVVSAAVSACDTAHDLWATVVASGADENNTGEAKGWKSLRKSQKGSNTLMDSLKQLTRGKKVAEAAEAAATAAAARRAVRTWWREGRAAHSLALTLETGLMSWAESLGEMPSSKPDEAAPPALFSRTHNTITLQWQCVDPGDKPLRCYVIEYKAVEGKAKRRGAAFGGSSRGYQPALWTEKRHFDNKHLKIILRGLRPCTGYALRMRVENDTGVSGERSSAIIVSTLPTPPEVREGHEGVTISWAVAMGEDQLHHELVHIASESAKVAAGAAPVENPSELEAVKLTKKKLRSLVRHRRYQLCMLKRRRHWPAHNEQKQKATEGLLMLVDEGVGRGGGDDDDDRSSTRKGTASSAAAAAAAGEPGADLHIVPALHIVPDGALPLQPPTMLMEDGQTKHPKWRLREDKRTGLHVEGGRANWEVVKLYGKKATNGKKGHVKLHWETEEDEAARLKAEKEALGPVETESDEDENMWLRAEADPLFIHHHHYDPVEHGEMVAKEDGKNAKAQAHPAHDAIDFEHQAVRWHTAELTLSWGVLDPEYEYFFSVQALAVGDSIGPYVETALRGGTKAGSGNQVVCSGWSEPVLYHLPVPKEPGPPTAAHLGTGSMQLRWGGVSSHRAPVVFYTIQTLTLLRLGMGGLQLIADDIEKKRQQGLEEADGGTGKHTKKVVEKEESWGEKWKREQDAREADRQKADNDRKRDALKKQLDGKRQRGRRASQAQIMQFKMLKYGANAVDLAAWWVRDQLVVHGHLPFPHNLCLHPSAAAPPTAEERRILADLNAGKLAKRRAEQLQEYKEERKLEEDERMRLEEIVQTNKNPGCWSVCAFCEPKTMMSSSDYLALGNGEASVVKTSSADNGDHGKNFSWKIDVNMLCDSGEASGSTDSNADGLRPEFGSGSVATKQESTIGPNGTGGELVCLRVLATNDVGYRSTASKPFTTVTKPEKIVLQESSSELLLVWKHHHHEEELHRQHVQQKKKTQSTSHESHVCWPTRYRLFVCCTLPDKTPSTEPSLRKTAWATGGKTSVEANIGRWCELELYTQSGERLYEIESAVVETDSATPADSTPVSARPNHNAGPTKTKRDELLGIVRLRKKPLKKGLMYWYSMRVELLLPNPLWMAQHLPNSDDPHYAVIEGHRKANEEEDGADGAGGGKAVVRAAPAIRSRKGSGATLMEILLVKKKMKSQIAKRGAARLAWIHEATKQLTTGTPTLCLQPSRAATTSPTKKSAAAKGVRPTILEAASGTVDDIKGAVAAALRGDRPTSMMNSAKTKHKDDGSNKPKGPWWKLGEHHRQELHWQQLQSSAAVTGGEAVSFAAWPLVTATAVSSAHTVDDSLAPDSPSRSGKVKSKEGLPTAARTSPKKGRQGSRWGDAWSAKTAPVIPAADGSIEDLSAASAEEEKLSTEAMVDAFDHLGETPVTYTISEAEQSRKDEAERKQSSRVVCAVSSCSAPVGFYIEVPPKMARPFVAAPPAASSTSSAAFHSGGTGRHGSHGGILAASVTPKSLRIGWAMCQCGGRAALRKHVLEYRPLRSSSWKIAYQGLDCSTVVRGLSEATVYEFRVKGVNVEDRHGPVGEVALAVTGVKDPRLVEDKDALTVQWNYDPCGATTYTLLVCALGQHKQRQQHHGHHGHHGHHHGHHNQADGTKAEGPTIHNPPFLPADPSIGKKSKLVEFVDSPKSKKKGSTGTKGKSGKTAKGKKTAKKGKEGGKSRKAAAADDSSTEPGIVYSAAQLPGGLNINMMTEISLYETPQEEEQTDIGRNSPQSKGSKSGRKNSQSIASALVCGSASGRKGARLKRPRLRPLFSIDAEGGIQGGACFTIPKSQLRHGVEYFVGIRAEVRQGGMVTAGTTAASMLVALSSFRSHVRMTPLPPTELEIDCAHELRLLLRWTVPEQRHQIAIRHASVSEAVAATAADADDSLAAARPRASLGEAENESGSYGAPVRQYVVEGVKLATGKAQRMALADGPMSKSIGGGGEDASKGFFEATMTSSSSSPHQEQPPRRKPSAQTDGKFVYDQRVSNKATDPVDSLLKLRSELKFEDSPFARYAHLRGGQSGDLAVAGEKSGAAGAAGAAGAGAAGPEGLAVGEDTVGDGRFGEWKVLATTTGTDDDGNDEVVECIVRDLTPDSLYALRVRSVGLQGTASVPTPPVLGLTTSGHSKYHHSKHHELTAEKYAPELQKLSKGVYCFDSMRVRAEAGVYAPLSVPSSTLTSHPGTLRSIPHKPTAAHPTQPLLHTLPTWQLDWGTNTASLPPPPLLSTSMVGVGTDMAATGPSHDGFGFSTTRRLPAPLGMATSTSAPMAATDASFDFSTSATTSLGATTHAVQRNQVQVRPLARADQLQERARAAAGKGGPGA
jgi:hypothetical protein